MSTLVATASTLWARIQEMEAELRFNGQAYPEGMCSFPFKLTGQGFFPGGDGLWRGDSELDQTSSGVLPVGGIVFLGNDFGTLKGFQKLRSKGYENPPTWRHLKERIRRAGLPEERAFFTNAIVGLRSAEAAKALDRRAWQAEPPFAGFCLEFLVYQIELLQPRLLVVLGPNARLSLDSLVGAGKGDGGGSLRATFGHHATALCYSSHPYGDFNFNSDSSQLAY